MAPALTPGLALVYLSELSADVRAGVVLDDGGHLLAGHPALLIAARELVAASDGSTASVGRARGGVVFAARATGLAIVLVCGPQAIDGLVLHDLRLVLGDLGALPAHPLAPVEAPAGATERAISAAQSAPEV